MSLTFNSNLMSFNLRLPDGRWDLSLLKEPNSYLKSVSMSLALRAGGDRLHWDGDLTHAEIDEKMVQDSIHGSVYSVAVTKMLMENRLLLHLHFALGHQMPIFLWRIQVENRSNESVFLDNLIMMSVGSERVFDRTRWKRLSAPIRRSFIESDVGALRLHKDPGDLGFFSTGWQSWTFSGTLGSDERMPRSRLGPITSPMAVNHGSHLPRQRGSFTSDMFGVIGDRHHRVGLLAGFISQRETFGGLDVHLDASNPYVCLWSNGDGMQLEPGRSFSTDWACLQFVDLDDEVPLEPYLDAVTRENNARRISISPIGWCSWYYFFNSVTQDDILSNLRWVEDKRDAVPIDIIQIDDGFQAEVGDWLKRDVRSFPMGMAQLSEQIREAGFMPGLWLAPFIAKPGAQLVRDNPEWILRNRWRLPTNPGFTFGTFSRALDVSHPSFLEYLQELILKITHEWGYDYLKLDFLYAGALPGVRFDDTQTRAQALNKALSVIRQSAGEKVLLLGCGCPLGSGVGIFDLMRIGPDVAPTWSPSYRGVKFPFTNEPGFPSARNAMQAAINRGFLHRKWWVNDPDCLLIRDRESQLTEAEVQSLATVISLSGGSLFTSDDLPSLSVSRMNWLTRLIPLLPSSARVVDWFDTAYPSHLLLPLSGECGSWQLLAVLNWKESAADFRINLAKLGLPHAKAYHAVDFWRESYHRIENDWLDLPPVPGHGVRLLAIRPVGDVPLWLGDTLHISQGLAVQEWTPQKNKLEVVLDLGRRANGKVWITLPSVPLSITQDGRPIAYRHDSSNVFECDLAMAGRSRLEISWDTRI
jgi:alpha-galactosidase